MKELRKNWEGCGRKGILHKNGGMMEVGAPIVRMGWPGRLLVHLPLFSLHHKIRKMASNNGGS